MKSIRRPLLLAILLLSGLAPFACSKSREAAQPESTRSAASTRAGDAAVHALDRAAAYNASTGGGDAPPLYEGLGDHHRSITTTSDQAQAYFDQGLRLQYAFNHAEAIRSYRAALSADPGCAMCWWGIALAAGNNINAGMDEEGGKLAFAAAAEAQARVDEASESERMLIAAISSRYGPRGAALAALGRRGAARAVLGELRAEARAAAEASGSDEEANPVLSIAAHALAGEIALRGGEPAAAAERFRRAAQIEDGMVYEEPPLWYYPIRHSLGRALIEAGDAAAAERAYREDLAKFPDNSWSLLGLAQSLEAQGRKAEAADARARFERAWTDADVELAASRL